MRGGYHRVSRRLLIFDFLEVSLVFLIHFAKGHFLGARRDLSCRLMRAVSQSFTKEGKFHKGDGGGYHRVSRRLLISDFEEGSHLRGMLHLRLTWLQTFNT